MSINQWATGNNNAAFALPLSAATPANPATQEYTLAWNPTTQELSWVPVSIGAVTGDVAPAGNVNLATGKRLQVAGVPVLGPRDTSWTAFTGTTNKLTAYPTGTVTLVQLAERVAAIQVALTTHGLIGA